MVDSAEEAERLYGSLDDFPGGYEVMEVTSEEALEYTGFM